MELESQSLQMERQFRIAIGAFLVVLVLAIYPFTNDPSGDIKRLITGWAAFALGSVWLGAVWTGRLPIRRPGVSLPLLLALLALFLIAALRSEFRWIGLLETGSFFFLFVLYFIASQVYRDITQARRLLLVVCWAMALASCYGFMQKAGLDPFPWADRSSEVYTNLPATFGNPNFAAHALILAIIMVVYLMATGLRWWWGSIFLLIFLTHLRFTGQRAGIIALAAAAFLVAVAWLFGRRTKRPVTAAAFVLILVMIISVAGAGVAMAVSKWRTGTSIPLDTSLVIRYQSYVSAADMLFDRPLLGYGPGVYGIAYPEYWTPFEQEWFAQELSMNAHVHNDLIELGIDAGLPAAGLYFTLLVLGMGYGLVMAFTPGPPERRRLGYMFAAFFLAFLVDGLFGFNLRVPVSAGIFFLTLGLLDGLWAASQPVETVISRSRNPLPRLALFAALMLFVLLESCRFSAAYCMQQGMRAQLKRDYPKARESFELGRSLAPWDGDFERRLGQVSIGEHDFDNAVRHFERALEINPYYILGRVPLAQTKMAVAQHLVQQDNAKVNDALAILDQAIDHLEELLKICPMFPPAHDMLGRVASVSALFVTQSGAPDAPGRAAAYWRSAETHLLKAIEYELENRSELYRMLAKVRIALGNQDGAEQALVRAAQADPADTETWPIFLDLANNRKDYDRLRNTLYAQIQRLKEADTLKPEALATAYLYLANVLENGYTDLDAVDQAFWGAVEYGPLRPEIWTNLARYAREKNRPMALQIAVAQSCGRLSIQGQKPLAYVAAVNDVMQRGPAALTSATANLLSHVRSHRANDALTADQAYGWAARMLLETAQSASRDTPGLCLANFNLGIVFAGLNELNAADQLFTRAQPCLETTQQAFLAVHWADVMVRQDRTPEALDLLRETRQKSPDNMDVQWALARTFVKLGLRDDAREEYKALLARPDLAPQGRAMLENELAGVQNGKT